MCCSKKYNYTRPDEVQKFILYQPDQVIAPWKLQPKRKVRSSRASVTSDARSRPPAYDLIMSSTGPKDGVSSATDMIPSNFRESNDENVALGTTSPASLSVHTGCMSGHKVKREYGKAGIIGGIVFFPWGLFWTACDSRATCKQCGLVVKDWGCKSKREKYAAIASVKGEKI